MSLKKISVKDAVTMFEKEAKMFNSHNDRFMNEEELARIAGFGVMLGGAYDGSTVLIMDCKVVIAHSVNQIFYSEDKNALYLSGTSAGGVLKKNEEGTAAEIRRSNIEAMDNCADIGITPLLVVKYQSIK